MEDEIKTSEVVGQLERMRVEKMTELMYESDMENEKVTSRLSFKNLNGVRK